MKRIGILALLMLLLTGIGWGASVRLSQSPGRGKRTVEVGDMFYIYMEVQDIDARPEVPKSVPGAKVMYFERTGQSSSFSSVNGRTTQSFSYTYTITLRATKEGSFSYGPVTVGGVRSNKVSYHIGAQGAQGSPAPSGAVPGNSRAGADSDKPKFIGKGDGNLFLRASVSKSSAYEQEALVYTVKLYTTYDAIKFIGASAAPKFDGFVVEESKAISSQLNYETYNGKTYATAVIARYIIFPQMTGSLKVSGNTYTVAVDQREYYHDPFFGSMSYSTPLQLNVTPNDLSVNVKPLPVPKPADFSGGVGKFSITSSLKSSEFKTNQAAAIVYTVSGSGNLKYVQLPDLQSIYPPQIEIYTPTTKQNISAGSSNVSGNVTFDYTFMPLEEGNVTIPEVKLVYFNPETQKYETSVARGYTVNVGKGKSSARSQSRKTVRFNPELLRVNPDKLSVRHVPVIRSFPYWLCFILPVVILAVALIVYKRYVSMHADIAALNSRRADKLARRRLKRAHDALRKGDVENFYTELLKALWGYLGDKLKMPTSELMRDNIRQVLAEKGIPESVVEDLISLIDEAEFAKYSSAGGKEGMDAAYSHAIDTINSLEESFKTSKTSSHKNIVSNDK